MHAPIYTQLHYLAPGNRTLNDGMYTLQNGTNNGVDCAHMACLHSSHRQFINLEIILLIHTNAMFSFPFDTYGS